MDDMTKYNITLRYIVTALKKKDPRNLTSVTQVYKARSTYNMSKKCPLMEIKMLLIRIYGEKYMCWTRNMNDSNVVTNIFWTHCD